VRFKILNFKIIIILENKIKIKKKTYPAGYEKNKWFRLYHICIIFFGIFVTPSGFWHLNIFGVWEWKNWPTMKKNLKIGLTKSLDSNLVFGSLSHLENGSYIWCFGHFSFWDKQVERQNKNSHSNKLSHFLEHMYGTFVQFPILVKKPTHIRCQIRFVTSNGGRGIKTFMLPLFRWI